MKSIHKLINGILGGCLMGLLGILLSFPMYGQACDYVGNIFVTAVGFDMGNNIVQTYLLVDPTTGVILDENTTGLFDPADDASYDLYALNYNSAAFTPTITPTVTTIVDLMAEIAGAGCGDLVGPENVFVCGENVQACFQTNNFFNVITAVDSWNQDNEQTYLLTDAAGNILATSTIGSFPTVTLAIGTYYIYAVNYDPPLAPAINGATTLADPVFSDPCVAITPSPNPAEGVEAVVELCCDADAGLLSFDPLCPEEDFILEVTGNLVDPNYQTWILILDDNGIILDVIDVTASNMHVIAYADWANLYNGVNQTYTFYSYNFSTIPAQTPNMQAAIGGMVSDIGNNNPTLACFDLSPDNGIDHFVPDVIASISQNVYDGNNGGVTPFHYNEHHIAFSGGTPPYTYNWNRTGYVRRDIALFNNGFVHPDDPTFDVSAPSRGGFIEIIYHENASWELTITDAHGCTDPAWTFANNFDPNDPMLDIQTQAITPATAPTISDGAIDITPQGGCPPYTYQWGGPFGFTATTEDINGLHYGWYVVTVTDSGTPTNGPAGACAEEQESTFGWYWVPWQVTGSGGGGFIRGKSAGAAENGLTIYPNPLKDQSTIEFSTATEGPTLVSLFNVEGKLITQLFDDVADGQASYQIPFAANGLPNGIYIVQLLTADGSVERQKLVIAQ